MIKIQLKKNQILGFIIFITLMSAMITKAYTPAYRLLSDEEVWDLSYAVAIVEIVSGSFKPSDQVFEVTANVSLLIYGSLDVQVSFDSRTLGSSPERLSGLYLVFLEQRDVDLYRSVLNIELYHLLTGSDESEDIAIWKSVTNAPKNIVRLGVEPWIPVSCTKGMLALDYRCDDDVNMLLFTHNKYSLRVRK